MFPAEESQQRNIQNPQFKADGAVFVTIKKNGALRGCIGHVQPVMSLSQSVIKNAIAASSSDQRFQPLKKEELKDIEVEVSILSPLLPLKDTENIQVGKHGLVIRKGATERHPASPGCNGIRVGQRYIP